MHRSASGGERGESIALPSEETGLAQRPSPCRYRMHFFFLLEQGREVSVSKGRVPARRGSAVPALPRGRAGGAAALRGHRQAAPAGRGSAAPAEQEDEGIKQDTNQNSEIKTKTAENKKTPSK